MAQVCDVVRVEFNGCAAAKLPNEIDVNVGDDVVTVRKQADGTWEGHVRDSFKPSQRTLTVDLPTVRTTCHVAGRPQAIAAGASCRAVFNVRCEQLWSLRVTNTLKKKTPLSYHCEKNAINSCDDPPPVGDNVPLTRESPLTIRPVGWSQGIILALSSSNGTSVEYAINEKTLRQPNSVRLSDLHPRTGVPSAVASNPTMKAFKDRQASEFEHIVLTRDAP
jgi:hypothetical protein